MGKILERSRKCWQRSRSRTDRFLNGFGCGREIRSVTMPRGVIGEEQSSSFKFPNFMSSISGLSVAGGSSVQSLTGNFDLSWKRNLNLQWHQCYEDLLKY